MNRQEIIKIFYHIFSCLILCFSFWTGCQEKTSVMAISFIAFCMFFIINNFDKISELKISLTGLDAKMKETIIDAEIKIKELKNIGKILAETELSLLIRSGRWGSFSCEEKEKIKNSILDVLDQLKISKIEQNKILDGDWSQFIKYDYVRAILGNGRAPEKTNLEVTNKWKYLNNFDNIPSPENILQFLSENGYLSEERKQYVEDYKYFVECKKHRRFEIWNNNQNWGVLKKI
jgi:hypothetical protein